MKPVIRSGHAISLLALMLLSIGVVMVNSAGLSVGDETGSVTLKSIALSRPTLYAIAAMLALAVASSTPVVTTLRRFIEARPRWEFSIPVLTGVLLLILLLPYAPGLGREVNGASRWIGVNVPGFGEVSVQPSELVKWMMLVVMARYCVLHHDRLALFKRGLVPGLCITGAIAAVVALEDLGTAVLIAAVATALLIAAGARFWHFACLAPVGLFMVAAAIIAEPYRMRRLTAFLDPYADPEGTGYHMIQSMIAVANGGGFGRGLGFGLQKFGYLPEDRTDFLFAVIAEELGVAGSALVLLLYIGLLLAILNVMRQERTRAMRLFALGVVATIAIQAIINLMAVTGLGPTKGIALPLLSAGGTGWVLTAASLGVIVGMDRLHAREPVDDVVERPQEFAPVVEPSVAC